jgi:hypothetical protein
MRGFVLTWLLAFALFGLAGYGVATALRGAEPPQFPAAAGNSRLSSLDLFESSAPFTESEAVDVVGGRFAVTRRGEEYRRELKQAARVTYHSAQHWTVRWGPASWTAHGPGRYAEPDNDAAKQRESEAASES